MNLPKLPLFSFVPYFFLLTCEVLIRGSANGFPVAKSPIFSVVTAETFLTMSSVYNTVKRAEQS